jgi:hypothetical protein
MKPYLSTMLALAALIIAMQAMWALALRGKTEVSAPGADPQAQLKYVTEEPVDAANFLVKDFRRSIPRLTHQALGVLGWLDAPIPIPVAVFLGMLIVLVALGEPGAPPVCAGFRWLGALIGIGGALMLHAMNYVWWTPPGAPFVAGIQGRHLLPFVPFLFVAIDSPGWIARPRSRPGRTVCAPRRRPFHCTAGRCSKEGDPVMTIASWLLGLTRGSLATLKKPRASAPRRRDHRHWQSAECLEVRTLLSSYGLGSAFAGVHFDNLSVLEELRLFRRHHPAGPARPDDARGHRRRLR